MLTFPPAKVPQLNPESLAALGAVTTDLLDSARSILRTDFIGCYLVGSFALGAGDEHSDVDFLVVTADVVGVDQQDALRVRHASFPDESNTWAQHLEGSYVPAAELRRPARPPGRWLYVDNGSRELEWSSHDDTAISRWVLQAHGIVLAGPDPATLVDPVQAADIRQESSSNIERSAVRLVDEGSGLESAWEQQHTVLAVCRCLYSMASGEVTSKLAAGAWAMKTLDAQWSSLIERAMAERPDAWVRVHQPAPAALVAGTRGFVQHARRRAQGKT